MKQKKLDFIVANDITASDSGFGTDTNRVTIIDRKGRIDRLPLLTKREVADKVLDRVAVLLRRGRIANSISITVKRSYINGYVRIFRRNRHLFPGFRVPFDLETDIGTFPVRVLDSGASVPVRQLREGTQNPDAEIHGLREWFEAHPQINVGDKLVVEVIEPMKRYRLKTA